MGRQRLELAEWRADASNPRPVPQFSQVTDLVNFGWATFHALEVQLRTRTKGFDNIYVSYTYSQSIIDAATFFGTYLFANNYAYNPTNTPHNLSVSFTTALMPKVGLRLSGIYSFVSGPPYPVNAGISLDGHQNRRASFLQDWNKQWGYWRHSGAVAGYQCVSRQPVRVCCRRRTLPRRPRNRPSRQVN